MPSNEFRTLKRKEREGREEKGEKEEQGEEKGGTVVGSGGGGGRRAHLEKQFNASNGFILIPSSSDFWLLFRSQKNGLELVTPILQSYF